ncbi:hypothetical protein Leucomu_03585 [Leucobacter muris]|uniref:Bacterial EndoU nuclease domain-containing protein n=1 Tax=Leucobacter muris TaxID=1935379 RepID=A0ABX5QDU5_9MICO|nr:hypothetical protein [Leucobacter muris]QAB17124.1 hypothetical protein Leucomu_03585 [Leucobacter muris]
MSAIGKLSRSQQSAARMAKDQLTKFWGLYGNLPAEELRDALLTFVPALGERYGDLAAAAAADWYEETVLAATGKPGAAVLAEVESDALVEAVRWAADDLYHGDPVDTWRKLEKSLQRHVKNASRGTVQRSATRSGVAFARVPSGARTCAFCEMLASRGFVYGSAELAGSIHRYHDECDCQQVPEFAMNAAERAAHDARVAEMYDRYSAARAEVEADGLALSEGNILQRLRDMHPDRYTDGASVPSILRSIDQGWPATVRPLTPRNWGHILKRHLNGGGAIDTFPETFTPYDIAKVIRETAAHPDARLPHPNPKFEGVENLHKVIDGQLYIVGVKHRGDLDGVLTAFPPSPSSPIMEAWRSWQNRK